MPADGGDDATVEQIRKMPSVLMYTMVYRGFKSVMCGKPGHLKKDCKSGKVGNKANGSGTNGSVDGSTNSLKDLRFSSEKIVLLFNVLHVPNIRKNLVSSSVLNNCGYKQAHANLGHVHFKRMQDMLKDGLIPAFDMDTEKCKTCMLTKITKKPFQNVKRETKVLELIHSDLCDLHATPSLGNKKYFVTFIDDASRFCYVYLLHSKDEALDKFKVFKTEVELQQGSQNKRFGTDRGGLNQGFWGEAMLTACYLLNRVPNKRNRITPYELWTKRKPNLNYLRVWGCTTVVRLPYPKLKTLGERGIKFIFVGYAKHSKGFRFSLVPRPSLGIPNGTEDIDGLVVLEEVTEEVVQQPEPELRKSKRNRNPKNFGHEFQLYLIEGTRDEVSDQHSYCFNVEDDPKTFDEAMKS
ncbi:zinc finger, CCHC-type containing protein [Tanacetum coccineum]